MLLFENSIPFSLSADEDKSDAEAQRRKADK